MHPNQWVQYEGMSIIQCNSGNLLMIVFIHYSHKGANNLVFFFILLKGVIGMKWIDAGTIADRDEVPKKLWKYENIMKQIPNFDKTDGAKKVYERKEYIILAVKKGYVVYNTEKPFIKGHSHIYGFNVAKTVIDNCIRKKMPKTRNLYLLTSHARVSNDEKYIRLVQELIEAKSDKRKLKYRNKNINSKRSK